MAQLAHHCNFERLRFTLLLNDFGYRTVVKGLTLLGGNFEDATFAVNDYPVDVRPTSEEFRRASANRSSEPTTKEYLGCYHASWHYLRRSLRLVLGGRERPSDEDQ